MKRPDKHRDDSMCEKIGASEAATARQEHQRGAVEESIPQTAPTQQKRSQHRAPTIVPATEPRGPQLRRQRGQRLHIASTIASGLRMVPSNKEAHQDIRRERERERKRGREIKRKRERDREHNNMQCELRRAPDLSCASSAPRSCAGWEPGAREPAAPQQAADGLEQ